MSQGINSNFVQDDDDELSGIDQDLELGAIRPKPSIKDYVKNKAAQLSDMRPREMLEAKKQEIQAFSLEEFMTDKRHVLFRAAGGEFLVTTLFLFIVCAVAINLHRSGHQDSESFVVGALATGFASVALIYSFADVSGAHFNPAVTFATIVTGKTSVPKGLLYMGMQLLASLFAMLLLTICFPPVVVNNVEQSVVSQLVVRPAADANIGRSFFMEIILTFILVYVIFAVAFDTVDNANTVRIVDEKGNAVDSRNRKNLTIYTTNGNSKAGFAPLSIGLTLGFLCFLGGSVSGGAFNPARVFGPGLCSWTWDHQWLYWLGDFTGAALAGLVQQRFFATKKPAQ